MTPADPTPAVPASDWAMKEARELADRVEAAEGDYYGARISYDHSVVAIAAALDRARERGANTMLRACINEKTLCGVEVDRINMRYEQLARASEIEAGGKKEGT